jgi:hypothetical protein
MAIATINVNSLRPAPSDLQPEGAVESCEHLHHAHVMKIGLSASTRSQISTSMEP